MTYSIWRPTKGVYDYYEVPSTMGDFENPATAHLARGGTPLGTTPIDAAHVLPPGARRVGSGARAKGMIARDGRGAVSGGSLSGIVDGTDSLFTRVRIGWALVALAIYKVLR